MIFSAPLAPGILLKRYKRFLADVRLNNGTKVTVHCPNSGSILSCSRPGSDVYISKSSNPQRKYSYTLEMIRENSTWIGINTTLTNHIVEEGIRNGDIAELRSPDNIMREVKTSPVSRLDMMLTKGTRKIFIEVKSCTLALDRCAMFPDAVTSRGTKHLRELADLVHQGQEGIMIFLVQRMDVDFFRPAAHIDPLYVETLTDVLRQGVQMLVYQAEVLPAGIRIVRSLSFSI